MRRTRSPCEMFSPSSGNLNSLAPEALAEGLADATGRAPSSCGLVSATGDGATVDCSSSRDEETDSACAWISIRDDGAVDFAAGNSPAFAPLPLSTVKMTCPTLIL